MLRTSVFLMTMMVMAASASAQGVEVSLAILAMPHAARAQQVDQWTAIQQLQADLKADRQAVVAANLPLTEGEAQAFWPAYKEYRAEVEKLGDRMVKLIAAYAANFETMTDTKADAFFDDLLAIDRDRVAVRERYRRFVPCCLAKRQRASSKSRTSSMPSSMSRWRPRFHWCL